MVVSSICKLNSDMVVAVTITSFMLSSTTQYLSTYPLKY
jgi:hypothetical protein